ncbi:MAG TPA: SCP2 sterol-binding domain-containing protein [Candidatus Eisenbacteria bacterium]
MRFGTPEWAAAFRAAINASSEYRNAGAKWGVGWNGNLLFVYEADVALPETRSLLVRLSGGRCEGCSWVDDARHPDAGFVLRAPFTLWREILGGRILAATAILTGRMKAEGDTLRLLAFAGAHRSLIHCAASVPTSFT